MQTAKPIPIVDKRSRANSVNLSARKPDTATKLKMRHTISYIPIRDLLTGSRDEYLKVAIPLYEASIRCDWEAAKRILDQKPELVKYAITENGETALHVSASAKGHKKTQEFVQHLVDLMDMVDLRLQNQNENTALYLAAAAGNITTVKIIMAKNRDLLTIPGAGGTMMPLDAAVLFGYYEVVKYLYENSNLSDDGWDHRNRDWLFQKCVENDMFDIAIQMVKVYPELASKGNALGILARKPDEFCVRKTSFIWEIIVSVLVFFGLKKRAPEKKTKALTLLKIIWESISKMPKKQIDNILRGPSDLSDSRKLMRVQLTKVISGHLDKLDRDTEKIIDGQPTPSTSIDIRDTFQLLTSLISEHIVNIRLETQNMINQHDKQVSSKEDQVMQKLINEKIVRLHFETQNISLRQDSRVHKRSQELKGLISEHIQEMRSLINIKDTYSNRIMFMAAEMGNTNFLVELIRQYPDLIWKVNDNDHSMFHIAVKHRHEGIYNLLFEIGAMKDMITPLRDEQGNNMLHLVGIIAKQKRISDVSGVALQMQRELLWFREVQKMIPPSYRERKNADNLTPHELSTNEHTHIVRQDEKWMKQIAGQCMVVAALIATMVFTAAFTVPGGYNQDDGIPIFYLEATYKVFVVADAISLLTSTTSILYMFVSVFFSSNYSELDFLESLPRKLMLGLLYLSVSILSMLIAFCVGFFILYHNGLLWMPILISTFALIPFYRSIKMFFLLFVDVIRFEYGSRNLFKPKKPILYYKNPRV